MNFENRKITVKHYLNKRAKIRLHHKVAFYPIYIQIIVNGKKAQIKSRIDEHLRIYRSDIDRLSNNDVELNQLIMGGYFSEKMLASINKEKKFPIYHLLQDEISLLQRIIRLARPFENELFTLSNISRQYEVFTAEITKIFDTKIKELYIEELRAIFLRSIDEEEKRHIFRISNFLIHFINWENSFNSFYDSIVEVMPTDVLEIEGLLSKELRITIKAFLAYHMHVNVLKRFFEKRELGKITTLCYLDWQTEIRGHVLEQFEAIHGKQKALEYVLALDNTLMKVIGTVQKNGFTIE